MKYHSNLFGHEGENSLLSYLISEGLALELSSSYDHELYHFSTFSVDITLTKKGIENVEKVIEAVFQYAHIVRDRGVQEYVFDEIKRIGEINFDFVDKSSPMNYTLKLASRMQLFETDDDLPHILRHAYVADELDHKRVQQMSELLCDPSRVNIYMRSKTFESQCT